MYVIDPYKPMTLDMQKLVTVEIDVYIFYSSSFKHKFYTVYSQYVLHLSSERRRINKTPFCMALLQTLETSIGRVMLAIFSTLPPISAILQINNTVKFHMS